MSTLHGLKQLYSGWWNSSWTGQKWKSNLFVATWTPVLMSFWILKPVFNVEEGWVVLVVIFLIERGHLYALCRGCYDIIFTCFPDPSSWSVEGKSNSKCQKLFGMHDLLVSCGFYSYKIYSFTRSISSKAQNKTFLKKIDVHVCHECIKIYILLFFFYS